MMSNIVKICPKCGECSIHGKEFCSECGTKMKDMPTCNYDGGTLWPRDKHCENCGRLYNEALNIPPPPPLFDRIKKRLKNWFTTSPA